MAQNSKRVWAAIDQIAREPELTGGPGELRSREQCAQGLGTTLYVANRPDGIGCRHHPATRDTARRLWINRVRICLCSIISIAARARARPNRFGNRAVVHGGQSP